MKKFTEVICIKSGRYKNIEFKVGDIYPMTGWNNGLHLMYENTEGDGAIMLLLNIDDYLGTGYPNEPEFIILRKD